jgi:hypothetical protein
VKGRWRVENGGRKFELDITQQYQNFDGVARFENRTVPLRETDLRGEEIRFVIEFDEGKRELFRGRVNGDKIEALPGEAGTLPMQAAGPWRAARN